MANLEGMQMKFTVVKNKHVEKFLSDEEREEFQILFDLVETRKNVHKARTSNREAGSERFIIPNQNKYLVINTDEPYADEVIDIMKKHGHWG